MPLTAQSPVPLIKAYQQDLMFLGFSLWPYQDDGDLGNLTIGRSHDAAVRYSLAPPVKKVVPDALVTGLQNIVNQLKTAPLVVPPHFRDLVDEAAAGWREGYRAFSEVDAIVFHQTGCPLIETRGVAYLDGNPLPPALARWARHYVGDHPQTGKKLYEALKTHFGVTYAGDILQIHPLEQWGWHAQSFSRRGIGIEIAGFFAGIEGDPSTRPGGPASWKTQSATQAQIDAVTVLVRYICQYVALHGGKIKYLFAHRQASDTRDPDPGSRVWKEIALPLRLELNLSDGGPGYVKGRGHPIPFAWDPAYVGVPYKTPKK